ncbi:hypothetical protein CFK39_14020 [Brachybacterium avium]|uniref:Uncharacterized protein n=1 Tax=Brachybacterium avium TaxID=2017485 RepID=A0A220UFK3_9MICO|nr:hypothetical protein CFK39_14020 [Brachybacterium avium]
MPEAGRADLHQVTLEQADPHQTVAVLATGRSTWFPSTTAWGHPWRSVQRHPAPVCETAARGALYLLVARA